MGDDEYGGRNETGWWWCGEKRWWVTNQIGLVELEGA